VMSMRCRAARQRREFKELEEEAFPSFPTRPLAMLNGKGGGAEQCIAGDEDLLGKVKGQTVIINKLKSDNVRGAEAGRLMADEDAEGREEEEVGSCYALQGVGVACRGGQLVCMLHLTLVLSMCRARARQQCHPPRRSPRLSTGRPEKQKTLSRLLVWPNSSPFPSKAVLGAEKTNRSIG
jgi:hypothetical protein